MAATEFHVRQFKKKKSSSLLKRQCGLLYRFNIGTRQASWCSPVKGLKQWITFYWF